MLRDLRHDLEGALQRAVVVSVCGFLAVLALAAGGYVLLRPVIGDPFTSTTPSASAPAELRAVRPSILPSAEEVKTSRSAVSVVPVNAQALLTTRESDDLILSPGPRVEAVAASADVATPVSLTPDLQPGDRTAVTLSFYYCDRGTLGLSPGDGGGFCGVMRDGSVVYNGAAACDVIYLGQRFRIEGDPLGRVYICADTGSAVHGLHRDIWFQNSDDGWNWQLKVGQTAVIEILP